MTTYRLATTARARPRILVLSNRDFAPVISRALRYEFEDLVGTFDAVDIVVPGERPDPATAVGPVAKAGSAARRLMSKLARRAWAKAERALPARAMRRRLEGISDDYDLLFVCTQSVTDLYNFSPISRWQSRARVSMCFIEELYAADISGLGNLRDVLRRFDHILVGVSDTVAPLQVATGRPCHYMTPSTDTLANCPYPDGFERVVDFYAMGAARRPEAHSALLRLAAESGWYYAYDTVIGDVRVVGHLQHRRRLADMIKRTRFFAVTTARWYDTERTRGQQELGLRYFEGASGGAVLVGDVPNNDAFDELFGWPDSVIQLPDDEQGIVDMLSSLAADPARLERISRANVSNSLRRHDHVHRWGQILAIAGLPETDEMAQRRRLLEEKAAELEA